ncbi:MAG: carboxypeptidase-like regulatory domain-containing protein [Tunicatimonas sp.]
MPLRCLLLFLLCSSLAFGQSPDTVVIEGMVVDADSTFILESVHLRVLNTNLGGVTRPDGRFKTRIARQDTLMFTRVGYQPYALVVADSTLEQLRQLTIRMQPQITMLNEVRVREYGDITKYIRREYDTTVDMRRPRGEPIFERKPRAEQKAVQLGVGPNGATLDGAVTAFANLFSSEYQQKKKVKELIAQEEVQTQQRALRQAMTQRYQALAQSVAKLTASELDQLTASHMPPPYVMREMSDYEVTTGIIEGLRTFDRQDDFLNELLENGAFEGQQKNQ